MYLYQKIGTDEIHETTLSQNLVQPVLKNETASVPNFRTVNSKDNIKTNTVNNVKNISSNWNNVKKEDFENNDFTINTEGEGYKKYKATIERLRQQHRSVRREGEHK